MLGGVGQPDPDFASWYVLQVYSPFGSDYRVFHRLAEAGFKAHCPQFVSCVLKTKNGRPLYEDGKRVEEEVIRPLFPGYILVALNLQKPGWGLVRDILGVVGVMCRKTDSGVVPMRLPMGFVETLQSRGRAGDGAIDERKPAFPNLAPGSVAKVTEGPFAGFEGIVGLSSGDRVKMLMAMFGAEREVEVSRGAVEGVT